MQCHIGDSAIFYKTHGAGRPIVILPGRPSNHHVMERFMEPLFKERPGWLRIYPDLPGTGLSTSTDSLVTHDQMLEIVLAFIDTVIPGQRFVLAGLSYGGYLARGVIARRVALIDGVMLCVPQVKADLTLTHRPSRATLVENPALLATLEKGEVQLVKDMVVVESPPVINEVRSVLTEVRQADFSLQQRLEDASPASFEVSDPNRTFDRPALIVTARQDHLCGYRDAWELLECYPRATFAVLDRAGHFANIEQNQLCHTLMGEWLDRIEEYRTGQAAG